MSLSTEHSFDALLKVIEGLWSTIDTQRLMIETQGSTIRSMKNALTSREI